jgi:hypothetical protein
MTAKMKRREFISRSPSWCAECSLIERCLALGHDAPPFPGASWQVPARLPQPWRVGRLCDLRLADLCGGIV